MGDQVMVEFAELGRAKARGRRVNLHKVDGSRRLMEQDYGLKCRSCRGTRVVDRRITHRGLSGERSQSFFGESSGLT